MRGRWAGAYGAVASKESGSRQVRGWRRAGVLAGGLEQRCDEPGSQTQKVKKKKSVSPCPIGTVESERSETSCRISSRT